ncbi:hypothetical protein TruAng_003116 [Truncatella angustata]|nr:hypothetical protein TruAng_003116 [Truncatella angustata]
MADQLKAMVKAKAHERRDRKWSSEIPAKEPEKAQNTPSENNEVLLQQMANHTLEASTEHENNDTSGSSSYTPGTSVTGDSPNADPTTGSYVANIPPFEPVLVETSTNTHIGQFLTPYHTKHYPDIESERELSFSMVYLDYVFPYISPFYRPPLLQGGRGWLLVLLMRNKPLFHAALSLASYFFSVMISSSILGHESCHQNNWNELLKQQELAIQSLQSSMQWLTGRGVANCFREAIHCLEGINQLLLFDATIGNTNNWQMHLDATNSIFEQIIEHHATDSTKPWYSILASMDKRSISIQFPNGEHPWSSDQASFRFLTMNLLWTDVLAATALERRPRLERFHQQLLVGDKPALQALDFIGCHNWVMLIIGQIAGLHAWKKEMKILGSLSMVELVKKGSCIERRLQEGIAELNMVPMDLLYDPSARAPDQPFAGSGFEAITNVGKLRSAAAQAFHTKIWAKAALTYVAVVVSGFQPALPEIQTNVSETMDLFRTMPSSLCLRTLVWPFAVTGCLSLAGQENFFRDLVGNMGVLQVFGTAKEALKIMEAIWPHRPCIDADIWDIATCLNCLGHASLLI